MVISSSNRSPSPMMMRQSQNPNTNPNSRTHQDREGIAPARKSFSGYSLGKASLISQPRSFIPNTPADYAKGNSFSGDNEQKENERDILNLKSIIRPRSPSVLKGSKNFMSPTISAASKINPSPRKKVLGERNEAIRTSASLSDGKFQFFSNGLLEFSDENEPNSKNDDPKTDFHKVPDKNVAPFSPGKVEFESEPDLVVLSPEAPLNLPLSESPKIENQSNVGLDVKNTSSSSPSTIAPLDADPSLPPYDPKTNYLSPRPQFLCYKPNPRIESYINQGLRLEDEFSFESLSETENSEESQSENPPKEEEECSYSSLSPSPVREESQSCKPKPTETQETEEVAEPEFEPKPCFFSKWKTVAFAFILLLGLITVSVTYCPSFGKAIYRDDIISKVYNDPHVVLDLTKVNFGGLFQRAKIWSANSVDHLSQMIHNFIEVDKFSPVLFVNLTNWQEEEDYEIGNFELSSFFEKKQDRDSRFGGFELSSFVEKKEEIQETTVDLRAETFAEAQSSPENEEEGSEDFSGSIGSVPYRIQKTTMDVRTENLSEVQSYPETVGEGVVKEDFSVNKEQYFERTLSDPETEEVVEETSLVELDCSVPYKMEELSTVLPPSQGEDSKAEHTQAETEMNADVVDPEDSSSQDPEMHPEVLASTKPLVDNNNDQSSTNDLETNDSEVILEAIPRNSQLLGLSITAVSVVASLLTAAAAAAAGAAFMYMKPKKETLAMPAASGVKEAPQVQESSRSGPVEVDMMSEPCPSEMSYHTPSNHSKMSGQRGADNEAQSHQSLERRTKSDYNKRESFASSSSEYTMDSSYGSFTTYSKIPSKKGDEEVVTPVRRSSRLRNHVISP